MCFSTQFLVMVKYVTSFLFGYCVVSAGSKLKESTRLKVTVRNTVLYYYILTIFFN